MRFLIQVNYLANTNCNFVLTPQTTPPPNDYSNTHEGNSIAKDNDNDKDTNYGLGRLSKPSNCT